jgi:hypothetical protein
MAAGQGFKTFTTGEVLTAGDVNGYLMQGVLVFASAAARNAAITSPQEGQFAFTKDTNGLWYYDGAAWVASGATGDIEGVTAGVGITGGGTSGTVTITNDMATTITASGDIVVGTGSGTYDNLPIGTTGQILTADTTVSPYKVKWATAAAPSSGMTLISTASFSGVSSTGTTFDGVLSSTYTYYQIMYSVYGSVNGAALQMQLRYAGPTTQTTGYYWLNDVIEGAGPSSTLTRNAAASEVQLSTYVSSAGRGTRGEVNLFTNDPSGGQRVAFLFNAFFMDNQGQASGAGQQDTGRAYTGFLFKPASGTLTGTISVYGLAL